MTPDRIITIRKAHGLTQAELGDLAGVSRQTIFRAENDGPISASLVAFMRLLDRFGAEAIETLRAG